MPEMPEMQGLAERLQEFIVGKRIERIDALQFSALKTVAPSPMDLAGREVNGVGRRGKYLILDLDGDRILVHLSQGGRVDVEEPAKATRPKGAVVRFRFEGGPAVLVKEFGTERKAAWWVLGTGDDGPLEKLGPEPDSDEYAVLIREGEDRRRLHTILRDQRTVAGIGRGNADDILNRAKLSPFESLAKLDADERERLLDATHAVLEEALAHERTRSGGLPTKLGDRFTVHRHFGKPCPNCGTTLEHVSYESHEVVYCPQCQTKGKVMADRRMSRLLK